jgi:hypothetical protein
LRLTQVRADYGAATQLDERIAHSFNTQYLAANIVASLTAPLVDGHRRRTRIEAAQAEANRITAEQGSALLRAAQEVIERQASLNGWVDQGAAAARLLVSLGIAPAER